MKTLRTKYLINPEFQLRLVILSFLPVLITLSIFYFQSVTAVREVKSLADTLLLEEKATALMMLETQELVLGRYFFWSSIVVFIISGIILMIVSHKMVGPLYRLEKHLEEINETGEVKLIRFRKKDYLQNLELQINKMFSKHQDYPAKDTEN
tara:strand:- start:1025 stop:1480 length:456 start_codon:yes stop_codon:yes gene_type:complete